MLNRPKPERVVNEDQGVDTAWKIHAAIVDWTGKVDTKASFASALESAAIVSLSASGRKLRSIGLAARYPLDWDRLPAFAALAAASVVASRLQSRATKSEWRDNSIYFGHFKTLALR